MSHDTNIMMSLQAAADLSDELQSAFNFVHSIIFLTLYIFSFRSQRAAVARSNQKQIDPVIKWAAIAYVSIYAIRYFTFVLLWCIGFDNISLFVRDVLLEYCIFDIGLVLGHCLFFLLMIIRLQRAFELSDYELSRCSLLVLYALWLSVFVVDELYFIVRRNRKKPGHIFYHDKTKNRFGVHTYLFLVVVLLSVVLGAILIYKFNKNVWHLLQYRQHNDAVTAHVRGVVPWASLRVQHKAHMIGQLADKLGEDKHSSKILGAAIKYTLLCSICIVCTNLQFSGWIFQNFGGIKKEASEVWFVIIWNWIFDLVLLLNFLLIWLSFPFAYTVYRKPYVCGKCHRACEYCCRRIVARNILHGHDGQSRDIVVELEQSEIVPLGAVSDETEQQPLS